MPRSARLRQGSLKTEIARELRQRVFSGQIVPGSKVDQDALAESFGVSKLPIREALISLESEGLVVNELRRGWFIAEISQEDILDHYRILAYVSGLMAARAAERLDEEGRERLADVFSRMSPDDGHSGSELEDLNFEFHWTVNSSTSSRRLRSVLKLFSEAVPARFFEIVHSWPQIAHDDHRRVLEAILDRDPVRADHAMAEHILRGGQRAVDYLTDRGFWDRDDSDADATQAEVVASRSAADRRHQRARSSS